MAVSNGAAGGGGAAAAATLAERRQEVEEMINAELEELWLDREHWKFFYAVYYCREDPRVVVPKINAAGRPIKWLGTTWNFAHYRAYPLILLVAAAALGPGAFVLYAGGGVWLAIVVLLVSFYAVFELTWHMATRAIPSSS